MITIIDYGMGNIGSVANMIRHCGGRSVTSADPQAIAGAQKLILPGIGAFDAGMAALRDAGLVEPIQQAVAKGATLLGICLGMQLLVEGSDEGSAQGLGLVPGRARLLQGGEQRLRVPHMGWNQVTPVRPSALFDPQADEQRFYFVHSYFVDCAESGDVSAVANYGHPFAASLERGRVMGVQFHPEKSHRYGMTLVRRFIALTP